MATLHTRPGEDIVAASANTAVATLKTGLGRLRGYHIRSGASAGSAIFRDGGSAGVTMFTVYTPASAAALVSMEIPGGGIPFDTSLHVTLSQADGITVFCSEGE